MTLPDLLDELDQAGIVLSVDGGRLAIDAPRGAMTPDLLDRLRTCKAELLDLLSDPQPHGDHGPDDDLPDAPPPGPDGWPVGCIDPAKLQPCPTCGRLELWQTMAGNWRCLVCDPPVVADRLRRTAERSKNRLPSGPGIDATPRP